MRLTAMVVGVALAVATPATATDLTPLVDVDWVVANGARPDVVLLDIRNDIDGGSRAIFVAGHIPGAIHSDYLRDGWRIEVDGVVGQTPEVAQLEALVGNLGINNDATVVVIPAGVSSTDFGSATRIYWTFKYLGHDAVAILDGGHRAWVASGQPLATGEPEIVADIFVAEPQPELLADADVKAGVLDSKVVLLDGRPLDQYTGKVAHPAARTPGRIPGATHFDHSQTFDDRTGKLMTPADIEALLPDTAADDAAIVSYCNTGHWASVNWFVLSEVLGKENVRLYDGSMVDWTQDPARPVDTGS